MHRCCCGGSHVTCTCGMMYQYHTETNNSSYSMMFSMPNGYGHYDDYEHDGYSTSSSFTPSASSVDCTLSLGTPSTRFTEDEEKRHRHDRRSSVTNFCWDMLQSKRHSQSQTKSTRGNSNSNNNNDPLVARRCANCDTTSTPLWRNGPRGPKSLCNACGIRYKKEERRASAAVAATSAAGSGGVYGHHHNNSWYGHSQNQRMSNELRFMDDSDRDSENNGIPFLSWKLNVADRTSLVHDFTR